MVVEFSCASTRGRLLVERFELIRAIIQTGLLLVEVLMAGIERVEGVTGVCWMDGRPAVSGEKLPGRRHQVRLLCRSCDESTFGGSGGRVTTSSPVVNSPQG